jgi:mRNA-degrading endonuclease RelE of RelBE toxin-antitoxin system
MEMKNFREIIFGNYRIIYEITDTEISILTIRLCRRLIDKEEITEKKYEDTGKSENPT